MRYRQNTKGDILYGPPVIAAIRRRIDQVYTHLYQFYDILEGKVSNLTQTNSHGLRIEESNELISGPKRLFKFT